MTRKLQLAWRGGLLLALAGALVIATLVTNTAQAQSPSGKATVAVSDVTLVEDTAGQDWTTVLSSQIKPPGGNRALFIDVSLQCGLYTQTEVRSRGGNKDTSSAQGTVTVRVLLNGEEAHPGEVVFCDRYQELSAELQGIVDVVDGELVIVDDETIELIQRTMNANAFNFVAHPLDSATTYDVEVQARVDSATSSQQGSSSAVAGIGKGSMTVDAHRLVQGDDVIVVD
ncbi:hypothetical protein [Salsipaludibacter albus]|uniref:hypothetical protein n=1 Tax=Salsipaludibacter albus TaxID=2849650 RepID=UPI001EE4B27B|nr:hypothetical protein [Salsipaludibacter albus]MBY5162309.1 hypothetical protein [Salsipaludibacter albus]